jgi:hypothetical protein
MFSRRSAMLAAVGMAGAAVSGCAAVRPGSDGVPAAVGPAATVSAVATGSPSVTSSPAATPVVTAPLTGEPVSSESALEHAAVAVKVSDVRSAHPQLGLNSADIVFVEPNGISYTRLCAVFHTHFPEFVGPVRSIRPVDVPLLSPLRPVFGNTAAAYWVMNYVNAHGADIENLWSFKAGVHGTRAYYTMPGRAAVHSVFCRPDELRKLARKMKAPPAFPYLPFATGGGPPSTAASASGARRIAVPWGPADTFDTSYDYDEKTGRYLRNEPWGKHILADGERVVTDNVLIVRARWKMDKIFVGRGAPDPVVSIVNGHGTFSYAHQGTCVKGTWTKGGTTDLFQFTLDDGSPLKLAPGRTFVELPQLDAKVKITA